MSLLGFSRKRSLVGLDIGSQLVKVMVTKAEKSGFVIESIGLANHKAGAFEGYHIANLELIGETIRNLWQNLGFKSKGVVLSIPGNEIITEISQITKIDKSGLDSYVRSNIKSFIMYSPDEVFYDYDVLNISEKENTMTLLIACAKRGTIYDYEKIMSLGGLDPKVLDVEYFALFNAFEATRGLKPEEVIALVDIGASKTIVVIVANSIPLYSKTFMIGSNELFFQLSDKFGLSSATTLELLNGHTDKLSVPEDEVKPLLLFYIDQIALEVKNGLDYFLNMGDFKKIDRVYLSGGLARSPGINHQLEQNIEIPVSIFNPFENDKVQAGKDVDPEYLRLVGPQMAVCFGLSLRKEESKKK